MCASYGTFRITRRWPLAIFYRHLDITGINAYVIFKFNIIKNKDRRRVFLKILAKSLMEDHLKDGSLLVSLPKDISTFLLKYKNRDVPVQDPVKPGICYICGKHKNK